MHVTEVLESPYEIIEIKGKMETFNEKKSSE